jgi:hypothetical protein
LKTTLLAFVTISPAVNVRIRNNCTSLDGTDEVPSVEVTIDKLFELLMVTLQSIEELFPSIVWAAEPEKIKDPVPPIGLVFTSAVVVLLFSIVPSLVNAAVGSTIKLVSKFTTLLAAEINSVPFTKNWALTEVKQNKQEITKNNLEKKE